MKVTRYVTEMGMGVDVHGGDYTKAAKRAVADAIRHSSLNFFTALDKSPHDMHITVKIGAPTARYKSFKAFSLNPDFSAIAMAGEELSLIRPIENNLLQGIHRGCEIAWGLRSPWTIHKQRVSYQDAAFTDIETDHSGCMSRSMNGANRAASDAQGVAAF